MAFNLATTPVQETVRCVSAYLDDVTGCSRALALQSQDPGAHERHSSLTLFHARSVPTIDLETYISRIVKYCPCQNEVFLGLIVYMQQMIDRCARRQMPFSVDAYSIHRLVITGVTIASKWYSDVFFTNSRYAKVGGLPVMELNTLELQFLSIIDFDLNVQPEVLQAIGTDLFSGCLPKLVNVHTHYFDQMQSPSFYAQVPANYTNAPQLQSPNSQCYYQQQQHQEQQEQQRQQQQVLMAYNYQQQQQQQQQARQVSRNSATSRSQRALRHMSYPGPSGVYYSNPYTYVRDKYHQTSSANQMATKHASSAANDPSSYAAQHPSSGSTLASSSPGDTAAIAALNQGVV